MTLRHTFRFMPGYWQSKSLPMLVLVVEAPDGEGYVLVADKVGGFDKMTWERTPSLTLMGQQDGELVRHEAYDSILERYERDGCENVHMTPDLVDMVQRMEKAMARFGFDVRYIQGSGFVADNLSPGTASDPIR